MADQSGNASMRARARLISLIGEELISDEAVAIVELVKNAYDADARRVSVEFRAAHDGGPVDTLVVRDDGHGMALNDVLTGWFEPGTIFKKRTERSPAGRLYQGAKGIGRFAAARLSESMFIETKREGEPAVTALVDWGRFDDDSYLDEIELEYETTDGIDAPVGTAITLEGLSRKKSWEKEDFENLQIRLSRLISPFEREGASSLDDFDISLHIPNHPDISGAVYAHEITKAPMYRLHGTVSADGKFSGEIEHFGHVQEVITERGLASVIAPCGAFSLDIRAWDRDREGLNLLMQKHTLTLSEIRTILDNYAGVSIYRDSFRVYPYGERGNDWLELDSRSRQNPTMRLANNQVISAIRISRAENFDLRDRSTREGLVHTPAYESLKARFVDVLQILEEARYKLRPREPRPQGTISLFESFDLSEVRQSLDKELGKEHPASRLITKKAVEVSKALTQLQEHYSRLLMAAGFGQLVDIVVHEIGAPLGRANRETAALERILEKSVNNILTPRLTPRVADLKEYLGQIQHRREALIPKTAGKRGRATSFSVAEEVRGNVDLFEGLIARQNIEVVVHSPTNDLRVHMSRSALGQVVSNLIDNAIYWLTKHYGAGGGGAIEIEIKPVEHGFELHVSDNGPGIPDEDIERVFELNFSKKSHGMGLGLYIAREVMEPYGTLTLANQRGRGGACFVARFERRVGL